MLPLRCFHGIGYNRKSCGGVYSSLVCGKKFVCELPRLEFASQRLVDNMQYVTMMCYLSVSQVAALANRPYGTFGTSAYEEPTSFPNPNMNSLQLATFTTHRLTAAHLILQVPTRADISPPTPHSNNRGDRGLIAAADIEDHQS